MLRRRRAGPEWTDAQLAELEDRKFQWIQMLHDRARQALLGGCQSRRQAARARVRPAHDRQPYHRGAPIWSPSGAARTGGQTSISRRSASSRKWPGTKRPVMERINPELTDGAYYGPSAAIVPALARFIGMPRAYGYGASMGAWILDIWPLGRRMGTGGPLVVFLSGPAYTGDVTIQTGEIVGKFVDEEGRSVVQVESRWPISSA